MPLTSCTCCRVLLLTQRIDLKAQIPDYNYSINFTIVSLLYHNVYDNGFVKYRMDVPVMYQ